MTGDQSRGPRTEDRRVVRLQALTGLCFALFLGLHLVNTMLAAGGQGTYDGFQDVTRRFYQQPLVEALIVGAAGLTHLTLGVLRWRGRRRRARGSAQPARPPRWLRLHRGAGWFLALVVVGHFGATRGPGLLLDMPADFSFLTFSLSSWPWVMYPYYFALYSCGVFHLLHGGRVALHVVGWRVGPPSALWLRVSLALSLVAGTLGILSMGALLGDVEVERFAEFRAFYERYLPFMANWD